MRISTKEASRQLGIPIPELQWQIETGQLPIGTVRVGEPTRYYPNGKRTFYIQQEKIDEYLKSKNTISELQKRLDELEEIIIKMRGIKEC